MMCADGFLPMIAEDEPPYIAWDGGRNISVSYFTCCPPQHTSPNTTTIDVTVTRHCSDPITAPIDLDANNDESVDAICDLQGTRESSRQMKPQWWWNVPDSFLCCNNSTPTIGHDDEINSNITTTATDFLDDLDHCLPYRNEFYEPSKIVQNQVGRLPVISCDFPEGPEKHFVIPRSINASSGIYQCCKDGHALPPLPPFVPDLSFKISLYPTIALFLVAGILSAAAAIGLLIPLLIQLKNGSFQRRSSRRRSSTRRGLPPRYSTYNLYLVYLALADLVYCLFQIALYGTTINQTFRSRFYPAVVVAPPLNNDDLLNVELTIACSYICTNFYINAVICYEVLVLLRASRRAQRITQPSLTKVHLQVGAAFIIGTIAGVCIYFLQHAILKAEKNGDNLEKSQMLEITSLIFVILIALMSGLPILYTFYVTFLIWLRGYIPSVNGATASDRAMRELAIYFRRIIMVFIGIWIPALILTMSPFWLDNTWGFVVGTWLVAIQPILTFCMILTKTDARKYIWDLVTLSYLFGDCACRKDKAKNTGAQNTPQFSHNRADDVADDNADDGVADDIDANADVDAAI